MLDDLWRNFANPNKSSLSTHVLSLGGQRSCCSPIGHARSNRSVHSGDVDCYVCDSNRTNHLLATSSISACTYFVDQCTYFASLVEHSAAVNLSQRVCGHYVAETLKAPSAACGRLYIRPLYITAFSFSRIAPSVCCFIRRPCSLALSCI